MGKPLRALIVEDSEDDALLVLRELRRGGYEPQFVRVETAEAMRDALNRQTWDVILSDFSLPQFNAPAALGVLKSTDLDIPFIIVSGTIGEDAAVTALKAGAHDFISKGKTPRLIPALERELQEAANRNSFRRTDAKLKQKSLFIELLQIIAVAANEASSAQEVLQFVLDKVCAYLKWSVGHVYLPDMNSNQFVSSHIWHLDKSDQFQSFKAVTEASRITPKEGFIGRVLDQRQPAWITEIAEHTLFTRSEQAVECGLSGVLAFPVLVGTDIVAVLEFYTVETIEVDQALLDEIASIGSQLGQVFERQQNEEALKRYNERLEVLHAIDKAILTMQPPDVVAELVVRFIKQQSIAQRASIALYDAKTHEAIELATYSARETQFSTGAHVPLEGMSEVIVNKLLAGEIVEIKDLTTLRHISSVIPALEAEGLRSVVSIPLMVEGQLAGTFNLGSVNHGDFNPQLVEVGKELAGQISIAIQQARYREQIDRHIAELEERVSERTAELLRAKNRTEAILNSSSDAIVLASFDGVIQQVNPATSELFGYSIDDLFGQSVITLTEVEETDTLLEALTVVVNEKIARTVEARARRKDGTEFDGDLALSPVLEEGTIKGIVGSLRDISERKEFERALQESEAKFRALIEFAPDSIVIVDAEGKIALVNRQISEFVGYDQEELIGQVVEVLLPESFRTAHVRHRADYMTDPTKRSMGEKLELVIRHKNGSEIPVEIGLSPIRVGDQMLVMAYVVDITAHRQLEQSLRAALVKEKELNELRTRFISMVSHDFRTPLTVIQSSTETLQRYYSQLDDAQKAKKFTNIHTQIERMVDLLNDVLTVSRADAGKIPFNPIMLDLDLFCRGITDEAHDIPTMQHKLVYTCSTTPLVVPFDEKLLQQAVINLLTNAFKYSPEGSEVRVDVSLDEEDAVIKVKDSGMGIPDADQPRLFETFHRAGNVGAIQGTGLGLAIVKRSVEAHGGTISFESRVGVGTTFIIRIPREGKRRDQDTGH